MSISPNETLWQKHKVAMLAVTPMPITVHIKTAQPSPILDNLVAKWRDEKNMPFPESDLTLRMFGAKSLETIGNVITIHGCPVSWGQYMTMRKYFSIIPEEEQFLQVAVSCLIETSDQHLILSFRSKNVATHKNMWHVSAAGGAMLSSIQSSRGFLFSIFTEIDEELNLTPIHISSVTQLGLYRHTGEDSANIEVCFLATTKISSKEVLTRAKDAKDTWEGKISTFPRDEVRRMIYTETFNPAGAATIITALRLS